MGAFDHMSQAVFLSGVEQAIAKAQAGKP